MGVFRQLIYDCGADMMGENFDKEAIVARLMALADRPVRFGSTIDKDSIPKVKVIFTNGIVSDVLADGLVDVEVVNIDDDYSDYDQLKAYEAQLYEDPSLEHINHTSANFEEDDGE